MAPDDVARADVEALDHRADAGQVAAAQRRRRQARLERAEPGAVEREHRGAVAGAERERARALVAVLGGQLLVGARRGAAADRDDGVVGALGERVQPGVERAEDGLVVVGGRAVLGQLGHVAGHRAGGDALERRDRGVDVGVVAVDRVDVVAQPDAGVGELQPRRPARPRRAAARAGRPARARSAARGRGSPAGSLCRRASIQPAAIPWSWLPASMTSSLSGPSASPTSAKNGAATSIASRCAASRSSSPSPRITKPVDVRERLQQRLAQVGAAQQVAAARSGRGGGRR